MDWSTDTDKWMERFKTMCGNLQASSINQNRINILFIGPPGHGKSASANSVLGKEAFEVSCDGASTDSSKKEWSAQSTFKNYKIKVVDCPAAPIAQPTNSKKVLTECGKIVPKILRQCPQGFHALFLVLQFGNRFNDTDKFALAMLQKIYGKTYIEEHCFCIVTYGDLFEEKLGKQNIIFHNWCRRQTGALKQMFEACIYKCLLFNNEVTDETIKKKQAQELMTLVIHSWQQTLSSISVSPELRIKADYHLIVESAPSEKAFRCQMQFVISYARRSWYEEKGVKSIVTILGKELQKRYSLNLFKSHEDFASALMKTEYPKPGSRIETTLEMVNKDKSLPTRCEVKHITILLTEGYTQDDSKASNEAARLTNSGTELILVAVNSTDRHRLENLTSKQENVFMVGNYEDLQDVTSDIKHHVCKLAPKFETNANILFILDSSASINAEDYKEEMEFAIKVTNTFNIGPGALRFSAMIFSSSPQMLFDFSLDKHEDIAKEIRKAAHLKERTNTAAALQFAKNNAFTHTSCDKKCKNIALVITDGCSNENKDQTASKAKELSLSGVVVFAIGVGQGINEAELQAIATRPSDVFHVENAHALEAIRNELAHRTNILETANIAQDELSQSNDNDGNDDPNEYSSQSFDDSDYVDSDEDLNFNTTTWRYSFFSVTDDSNRNSAAKCIVL